MKTIILLCDAFPSTKSETFLCNEFNFIKTSKDFRIIFFPYKYYDNSADKIECEFYQRWEKRFRFARKLNWRVATLLKREFWEEIIILSKQNRLSWSRINTLWSFIANAEEWIKFIKKTIAKIDIANSEIIIYSYWFYIQSYAGARLKECIKDSYFISRCHRFDLYEERNIDCYLPCRHYVYSKLDRLYSISKDGMQYLNDNYEYVRNCNKVELSRLGTFDHGVSQLKDGTIRIVSCSNIVDVKRIDKIIEVLCNLSFPVEWVHFGDGPLFSQMKEYANEKFVGTKVTYIFMGRTKNSQIMNFYLSNRVDLFLNLSFSEGIPVSIMEALSFGIPVVASDVGGTREIVFDGVNGILVQNNEDVESIASKIESFVKKSESEIKKFRNQARIIWEKNYSARENYYNFYQSLLETR